MYNDEIPMLGVRLRDAGFGQVEIMAILAATLYCRDQQDKSEFVVRFGTISRDILGEMRIQ